MFKLFSAFFISALLLSACAKLAKPRPELGETYLIEDASCAGFCFVNDSILTWTNELFCNDPDTLCYQWISESMFFTKQIHPHAENCPPRIDLHQVLKADGQGMVLLNFGTSWNYHTADTSIFWRMHPVMH